MSTARADLKSTISADTTQFAASMRRAGMIAKTTGANIGKGMADGTRAIARLGANAFKTSAAVAGIGGAIVAGAFAKGIKSAADLGGALSDVAAQTGVSAGRMAILQKAFQDNGLAAEQAGPAINKMQRFIRDLGDGTPAAVKAFDTLGIGLSELQSLSPDKQLELIGKRIMAISDPAARAATAMDIFGRSGGKMITLFGDAGAMGNAAGFLGTAADILDRRASDFDSISDKLAGIPAKLQTFFVGFLDGVAEPIQAILTKFESIDFAAIGQRFAAGFSGGNLVSVFSAISELLAVAIGEGFTKGLQFAGALLSAAFSKEGMSFIGDILIDVFISAFDAIGGAVYELGKTISKSLKGEVDMVDKTRVYGTTKPEEEKPKTFASNLENALKQIEWAPSDKMKEAAGKFSNEMGRLFPKVEGSGGSSSESDAYDAELAEQRERVAADAAAMAPIEQMGPPAPIEHHGPPAPPKMFRTGLAGGVDGLADAQSKYASIGMTGSFAKDKERLGLARGGIGGNSFNGVTGGLGAKRAVGKQREDAENKKNLTVAEKQSATLESIDGKIAASLTVK